MQLHAQCALLYPASWHNIRAPHRLHAAWQAGVGMDTARRPRSSTTSGTPGGRALWTAPYLSSAQFPRGCFPCSCRGNQQSETWPLSSMATSSMSLTPSGRQWPTTLFGVWPTPAMTRWPRSGATRTQWPQLCTDRRTCGVLE